MRIYIYLDEQSKQTSTKAYIHNKNQIFRVFGDFEQIKCKFIY